MKEIYIDDLREEFVKDYVFPMFRWLQIEGHLLILLAVAAMSILHWWSAHRVARAC